MSVKTAGEEERGWIDISVPLTDRMLRWPGDPVVRIRRTARLEDGAEANLTHLAMGAHTGTHLDSPRHFLADGPAVDRMPPGIMLGPARVIAIPHPAVINAEALGPLRLRRGERILFRTRNSEADWWSAPFRETFVHLTPEAAERLAAAGVALVGVDYLSVSGWGKPAAEVHRPLLAAGVWVLEGLRLGCVPPGACELICLPLLIPGADGAPARALVRPRGGTGPRRFRAPRPHA
jgi:arylformamidase